MNSFNLKFVEHSWSKRCHFLQISAFYKYIIQIYGALLINKLQLLKIINFEICSHRKNCETATHHVSTGKIIMVITHTKQWISQRKRTPD